MSTDTKFIPTLNPVFLYVVIYLGWILNQEFFTHVRLFVTPTTDLTLSFLFQWADFI